MTDILDLLRGANTVSVDDSGFSLLSGLTVQQALADSDSALVGLSDIATTTRTALGSAPGVPHMGTFLGTLLPDDSDAKTLFQVLETAVEAGTGGVTELGELTNVTDTSTSAGFVMYSTAAETWATDLPGATSGVQAWDAGLDSISGLTTAADQMIYTTASDAYATTTLTAFARNLLDDPDAATARTTLGLVSGGAGDIWVKKAGDTMTGNLVMPDTTTPSVTFTTQAKGGLWSPPDGRGDPQDVIVGIDGHATITFSEQNNLIGSIGDWGRIEMAASPTAGIGFRNTSGSSVAFLNGDNNGFNVNVGGAAAVTFGLTSITFNQTTTFGSNSVSSTFVPSSNEHLVNKLFVDSNFQALDATLTGIAALSPTADQMIYATGSDVFATAALTTAGRALLDDATAADQRTTLGLVSGGAGDIWVKKAGDTMTGFLTLNADPTAALHAVTKQYADALVFGLNPKKAVIGTTNSDIGGTYNASGGTGGTGSFTGVDLTSDAIFDGVPSTAAYQADDRILIKDQIDPKQNGIFVVITPGASGVIERAEDHDGTPANEVATGNSTFVSIGTLYSGQTWKITSGTGTLVLNTDDIVWGLISNAGDWTWGNGLTNSGNIVSAVLETTGSAQSLGTLSFNGDSIAVDLGFTSTVAMPGNASLADLSSAALADLSDVSENSLATGQLLYKSSGDWTNTSSLYWDDVNNRLGIGTDIALARLHVEQQVEGAIARFRGSDESRALEIGSFTTGGSFTGAGIDLNATSAFGVLSFSTSSLEAFRIDDNQRVLVGTDVSTATRGVARSFQIEGITDATGSMSIIRNGNNGNGPKLVLGSTRGTTNNSNSLVLNNDETGQILFVAGDGTDKESATAAIVSFVDDVASANDTPGRLSIYTTPTGSNTPVQRWAIVNNGQNRIFRAGTAANPALIVGNDVDTGIFLPGANNFAISTAGLERTRVNFEGKLIHGLTTDGNQVAGTGARINSGSAGNENQQCLSLRGSGGDFYSIGFETSGDKQWIRNISAGGLDVFDIGIGSNLLIRATEDYRVALGQITPAQNLHIYENTSSSVRLRLQNSEGSSDIGTDGGGKLIFFVAGAEAGRFEANNIFEVNGATDNRITPGTDDGTDNKSLTICGGGASSSARGAIAAFYGNEHPTNPGLASFIAGETAGSELRLSAPSSTGFINFRVAGSDVARLDAGGRLSISDGNAGNPGIKFLNDPDTGITRTGTNILGLVTAGASRLSISEAGQIVVGGSEFDGKFRVVDGSAGTVSANTSANEIVAEASGNGGISILTNDSALGSLVFGSPSDNLGARLRWNYNSAELWLSTNTASGAIKIQTGDGVEAVTVDSSQRVLIGKTSVGLGNVGHQFNPTGTAIFTASNQAPIVVNRITGNDSLIELYSNTTLQFGRIGSHGGAFSFQADSDMALESTNTMNFSIDSDNNSSSNGYNFYVGRANNVGGTALMQLSRTGTLTFNAYGAGTLSTNASGVVSASDARIKIVLDEEVKGRETVMALKPTWWDYNGKLGYKPGEPQLGFVAQDVAKVDPRFAPGSDKVPVAQKRRNFHDRAILASLVKHNQELETDKEKLTRKVNGLEARLAKLERKLGAA